MRVRIDQIIPDPNQPRKTFDDEAINELASSFDSYGVISPVKVRPYGDHQYMIITGEMRYRAAKQRGDKEIEVGEAIEVTDQQAREMQFIENLQRKDIPPLELGEAFYNHRNEYKLTQEQLAAIVGKSREAISSYELLYKGLAIITKNYIKEGKVDFAVALDIARVKDEARQTEFADIAVERRLGKAATQQIASLINAQTERPVVDIVDDIISGKAKEEELTRLEAAKQATGITIETPEDLMRGAEALKKEAERKAKEAMTPEEKAEEERKKLVAEARKSLDSTTKKIDRAGQVMDVSEFRGRLSNIQQSLEKQPTEARAQLIALGEEVTEAEKNTKAEVKRLKDEETKKRKEQERQHLEEQAMSKARTRLAKDPDFVSQVIRKQQLSLDISVPRQAREEIQRKEGIVYTVGEFDCPNCRRHVSIKCDGKRHWGE